MLQRRSTSHGNQSWKTLIIATLDVGSEVTWHRRNKAPSLKHLASCWTLDAENARKESMTSGVLLDPHGSPAVQLNWIFALHTLAPQDNFVKFTRNSDVQWTFLKGKLRGIQL